MNEYVPKEAPAFAAGLSSVRSSVAGRLVVSVGQCSDKGRKPFNQDFHGALIPDGSVLASKGMVIALADGIGSSPVSHIAAETAVKSLLTDYHCTSDAWSAKTSAQRVISATNSWLHAETKRSQSAYDLDKGYMCTLTALVLKGRRAHLFHVGDSRAARVAGDTLEQLTVDHHTVLSSQEKYLGRALGMAPHVEIDHRVLDLAQGDVFVLATDGVHEHVPPETMTATISRFGDDLDGAARALVDEALARGSDDNLTVQIVRIEQLPNWDVQAYGGPAETLPVPAPLESRALLDGYRIIRPLHASSRSHLYLASDEAASGALVALKIPSVDLRDDPVYLQRFMMEEWVARRIDNPHVAKAYGQDRRRTHCYTVMEYVDGQTLRQWMIDHPKPDLETVRRIVEQTVRGLRAFHRREMLHQDVRPENIMIDRQGTVKIVDFGSVRVAGVQEGQPDLASGGIAGALQYAAPEYFLGQAGTPRSDLFSLGVIAYEMLTGRLPYGAAVPRTRTRKQQRKLRYSPGASTESGIPDWIDGALRKAVQPDPVKRYQALSEFLQDFRYPNPAFAREGGAPLYERNPLLFWKVLALVQGAALVALAGKLLF